MNTDQPYNSQSASFHQNGFTVLKNCFNSRHAEAINAASAKLLGDSNTEANNWINAPHAASSTILEALLHTPLLDSLERLIGANFVCWGSSLLCKWPQTASAVNWHQDAGYWPLKPAATVTAWIAVDDATPLNGCLSVIPGSHRNGPLPYDDTEPGAHAFGFDSRRIKPELLTTAPLQLPIHAGDAILFSDQLVHGSGPNHTDQRRLALVARYAPEHVRAENGWNRQAILCRGHDPSGHWTQGHLG